ncbi:hypothetical protein [Nesterenkonia xinjiangensis]|uniref:Uncharacterized protein n=1 Tax=Nesterenkonia xinjiangensis TaxID=225327 RepID=A0A7Z0GJK6_9MICC|nr:hypothetical protein [Nesterenkonia xinjiangensis]NYJ77201.1 hypothetical protein [Nesterenkonia xinjiangensis]
MTRQQEGSDRPEFSPLPESLRVAENVEPDDPVLDGSARIVELGAHCDFFHLPAVGDPSGHFAVTEYCTLDDGRAVKLRDLGFTLSATRYAPGGGREANPTSGLTLDVIAQEVRTTTAPDALPDGTVLDEEHDWEELALFARDAGLRTTSEELRELDYVFTFAERVVEQFARG